MKGAINGHPLCPSCGMSNMSVFYRKANIPVNSCALLETEQQATYFPKGDIVLAFCKNCGFISNIAFDSSKVDYSATYEDQQCFSHSFNTYARHIAEHLIEKYSLHKKNILEIGCGKGDFLALLCRLGPNRGVGIDPAYIEGRVENKDLERIVFIRDFYSEKYANRNGDFVCCRHTLEHIPNVHKFVSTLRRSIGNCLGTNVFFEIPEVTRILAELAFWDIYYEHCSYFSPGSIARLFRSCRFKISSLSKDFDDQYLLIEASPTRKKSIRINKLEETVEDLWKIVNHFSKHSRKNLTRWKTRLNEMKRSGRRVVVWGSGSKCVSFLTTLDVADEIEYVVDINPFRHGKYLPGTNKQIMSPEALADNKPDIVIVMNPIYRGEIKQMLSRKGLAPKMITV